MSFTSIVISSASGSTPPPTIVFPQNGNNVLFFLAFIVVILTLRLYRGISGRRYSRARVMRLPIVYTAITLITVLGVGFIDEVLLYTLVLIPVGFLFGYRLGSNVNFFTSNGAVYYKRSPVIMILWLVSFLGRIILEFFFATNLQVLLIIDSALALTTGLIMGEAYNLITERKSYVPAGSGETDGSSDFRMNR